MTCPQGGLHDLVLLIVNWAVASGALQVTAAARIVGEALEENQILAAGLFSLTAGGYALFQPAHRPAAVGQLGFFKKRQASEQLPYAIERFQTEAERVLAVFEKVLAASPFVAGDELTIAGITHFGWMWCREFAGIELAAAPGIAGWYERMSARPAVVRAIERVGRLVPVDS